MLDILHPCHFSLTFYNYKWHNFAVVITVNLLTAECTAITIQETFYYIIYVNGKSKRIFYCFFFASNDVIPSTFCLYTNEHFFSV